MGAGEDEVCFGDGGEGGAEFEEGGSGERVLAWCCLGLEIGV